MEFNWRRGLIGGGILGIIILASFAPMIYKEYNKTPEDRLAEEEKWDKIYSCLPIPDDVPKEYVWGPDVKWNCTLQSAYNDGKLIIVYPKNGDRKYCESIKYVSGGDTILCDFEKMTSH